MPLSGGLKTIRDDESVTSNSSITPVRRVKSLGDFYDAVRSRMKVENRDEKRKRRYRSHISDEIHFESWYQGVRGELADASHATYQLYEDQLIHTEAHLDSLLASANSTLSILSSLAESFKAVDNQTTEFQAECESILAEERRTAKLADDIAENLQYYNYLEPITKRLNAPGAGSLVRRSEFPEMLANLDACLEYMQEHPKQREAKTYAAKYRLLLTRGLTLIRNHFTSSLKDLGAEVFKKIADRQPNDTTISALMYAKFRVPAPELKQLGQEVQKRAFAPTDAVPGTEGEYQGLMNELHQSFATTRTKLLQPIIAKKISEIAAAPSSSKDLVSLARSCTSFMKGLPPAKTSAYLYSLFNSN